MAASAPQLSGIQILRGIAAVGVVIQHAFGHSFLVEPGTANHGWLATVGAAGVDLFFVISGFIMLYVSFPTQSAPLKPGQFLLRRITRIYPFYWICSLAVALPWMVGFLSSKPFTAGTVTKSLLLVPVPVTEQLIAVSWTLSYEMLFYLVFAGTLLFRSRVVSALLSTFVIIAVILIGSRLPVGEMKRFLANPVMVEFCFGLLLALAWSRGVRATSVVWMVAGFLVIMIAPLVLEGRTLATWPSVIIWPSVARPLAWGVPSVAVLAGFLAIAPARNLGTRFAILVGDASYAIYLTHLFFVSVSGRLIETTVVGKLPQFVVVPVVIALCVAIGIAVHIVIETPVLALVRNFSRSRQRRILAGKSAPGSSG